VESSWIKTLSGRHPTWSCRHYCYYDYYYYY